MLSTHAVIACPRSPTKKDKECESWCRKIYGEGPKEGVAECISAGAELKGPCYECGPRRPRSPSGSACSLQSCAGSFQCPHGSKCWSGFCTIPKGTPGDLECDSAVGPLNFSSIPTTLRNSPRQWEDRKSGANEVQCINGERCNNGICSCPNGMLNDVNNCDQCGISVRLSPLL